MDVGRGRRVGIGARGVVDAHRRLAGRRLRGRSRASRPRSRRWRAPATWTLREAGNGPVVTRSSSTFGGELGGREWSGIGHRRSPLRRLNDDPGHDARRRFGFRRGVPVPTPARPGSGSKGFRAPAISGRRRLSPLPGHPLDDAIIRRGPRRRQGCGLMICRRGRGQPGSAWRRRHMCLVVGTWFVRTRPLPRQRLRAPLFPLLSAENVEPSALSPSGQPGLLANQLDDLTIRCDHGNSTVPEY